jgi:cytochrome c peroxidase
MNRFLLFGVGAMIFLLVLNSFEPVQNPSTKEELGEKLFFDPILSSDKTLSCASCHIPQFAFADTLPFSRGVSGRLTARNTPSVMNMSARETFFWDGRATSLEGQVVGPVENPNEMNLPFKEYSGVRQTVPPLWKQLLPMSELWKRIKHPMTDGSMTSPMA